MRNSSSNIIIIWRWDDTDPFGASRPDQNPSGLGTFTYDQRFPGQMFDQETNLFYNYFRYYDPQTGRYTTSDPLGLAAGINTYSYVRGNPIVKIDPKGLVEWQGTVLSANAGIGPLGGGVDIYTLRSPCIDGEITVVRVVARYLPVGVGSPWSYTGSNVTFQDNLRFPDPNVFNGDYSKASAGAALGGGFTFGGAYMGDAESDWDWGGEAGFDLTIGTTVGGKATVISSHTEPCPCKK